MTATLVKLEAAPDLVERVYRSLHDAISAGALAPLARITQEDVARQLAVSRQPVLQALRLLKADGLLQDAPGRGLQVTALQPQTLGRVYAVRGALDTLAARLAAEQRALIDPKLIERGRKAARGRNVPALIEADFAFHHAVYVASGNPLIERSAQLHWSHIRRAMGAVLQKSALRESVWDDHADIAAAIGRGQVATAGRLMQAHADRAAAYLTEQLSLNPNIPAPQRPSTGAPR